VVCSSPGRKGVCPTSATLMQNHAADGRDLGARTRLLYSNFAVLTTFGAVIILWKKRRGVSHDNDI
jgi:hypothetical protein